MTSHWDIRIDQNVETQSLVTQITNKKVYSNLEEMKAISIVHGSGSYVLRDEKHEFEMQNLFNLFPEKKNIRHEVNILVITSYSLCLVWFSRPISVNL